MLYFPQLFLHSFLYEFRASEWKYMCTMKKKKYKLVRCEKKNNESYALEIVFGEKSQYCVFFIIEHFDDCICAYWKWKGINLLKLFSLSLLYAKTRKHSSERFYILPIPIRLSWRHESKWENWENCESNKIVSLRFYSDDDDYDMRKLRNYIRCFLFDNKNKEKKRTNT